MSRDKNKISDSERLEKLRDRKREIIRHSGNFSPAEMIESGQAKKYSSKRELVIAVLAVVSGLLVFGLFMFVLRYGFRIKTIEVTNKTDFFAEEVIRASGVVPGASYFYTSTDAAVSNIRARIPYAGNVTVKKSFPSKMSISLEKILGKYYVSAGGEYYVLDKEMRVIARTEKIEDIELMGCIRLKSREIAECVLGKKISFYDMDTDRVLAELIGLLEDEAMLGFCSAIIIDSKFDIRFECYGRYNVLLGDLRDLELKISLLREVMNDLPEEAGGEIDVSDKNLRKAIVTLYD